jgi:hypothetical protein
MFYNTKSFGLPSNFASKRSEMGENRGEEGKGKWGAVGCGCKWIRVKGNFCIYTCWFNFDWTRFQLSKPKQPNRMIFLVFKLVFLGFYLGSVFFIFYPSIFLIGRSIFLSLYFLHIIKSSVYTAIIFQPKCLYLSTLF